MPIFKRKALAYLAHNGRLLVFRHRDFPEAGIQVPAGTMEAGEAPEAAVLREAAEETGLSGLLIVRKLGEQVIKMNDYGLDEIQHRYYFQLISPTPPPSSRTVSTAKLLKTACQMLRLRLVKKVPSMRERKTRRVLDKFGPAFGLIAPGSLSAGRAAGKRTSEESPSCP